MNYIQLILIGWAGLNTVAYLLMWYDKLAAIKKKSRIRERTLFIIAFLGGAAGIYLGMKAPLYHKAAKPLFKFSILPLVLLELAGIVYWVYYLYSK